MNKAFLLVLAVLFSQIVIAQEWEQKANPPGSFDTRHHPVTFAIDGFGYIGTGVNQANVPLRDFYKYDTVNDTWEEMADFPGVARGFSYGVAADNGKGYMGFGVDTNGELNDFWEFDPATNMWTELASCPCEARHHPAMVYAADKIYIGTGSGANANLKDWWAYDIATDSWEQKQNFPGVVRHHPFYFGLDGDAYVGFGHGSGIFKDFYKYRTATEDWTQVTAFPGEARVAGTQFSSNGKGYLLSGDGDTHDHMDTGEMWEFDPALNTWTSLPPHPGISRWAPGSFEVDGQVYFGFGWINGENYDDLMSFNLNTFVATKDVLDVDIQLYPNPVSDKLIVTTQETFDAFEILDASGKLILKGNWNSNEINVSTFVNGIYSIQFFKGAKSQMEKFSVVR